jgi:hypothetical protein
MSATGSSCVVSCRRGRGVVVPGSREIIRTIGSTDVGA